MRFSSHILTLALTSSVVATSAAFCTSHPSSSAIRGQQQLRTSSSLNLSPPSDDPQQPSASSASFLSQYLVKAHQEKLLAIKKVQDQKDAEIKLLQEQVAALQRRQPSFSSSSTSYNDLLSKSKEELIDLIRHYQQFVADYVVKASAQRFRAVEDAKQAILARFLTPPTAGSTQATSVAAPSSVYEQRNQVVQAAGSKSRWGEREMERISGAIASAVSNVVVAAASNNNALPEYEKRNTNVLHAFLEGKSRWMEEEVSRIQGKMVVPTYKASAASMIAATPPRSASAAQVNGAVQEADHGLRADGGVGGLTLTDRVGSGAAAFLGSVAESVSAGVKSYYEERNQNLIQAQADDKARWGDEEIDRIQGRMTVPAFKATAAKMIAATPPVFQSQSQVDSAVQAADHGLRADGGVGGLTLGQRVNLGAAAVASAAVNTMKSLSTSPSTTWTNIGASILASSGSVASSGSNTAETSAYQKRNENVLQSAVAGLSRWGADEVSRIQSSASSSSSSSAALSPDDLSKIQAADHGLRADGGVGGLTLFERIAKGVNEGQAVVEAGLNAASSQISEVNILYDERNKNVLKQGSQSRWGGQEVQRIQFSNSTGAAVSV